MAHSNAERVRTEPLTSR